MDKDTSWRVVDERRVVVADLLESLGPEQWATPSLCDGWTSATSGAHLSMAATSRAADMVPWVVRSRGSFDRMIRDSAITGARGRRTRSSPTCGASWAPASWPPRPSGAIPCSTRSSTPTTSPGPWASRCPHLRTPHVRRPTGRGPPVPVLPRLAAAGVRLVRRRRRVVSGRWAGAPRSRRVAAAWCRPVGPRGWTSWTVRGWRWRGRGWAWRRARRSRGEHH